MNNDIMFSSKTDQWYIPIEFFKELDEEFKFDLASAGGQAGTHGTTSEAEGMHENVISKRDRMEGIRWTKNRQRLNV